MTIRKPSEYKAIWLWGRQLGSMDYFIKGEQVEAARTGAPLDALFRSHGGKWHCLSDLKEDHPFRKSFEERFPDESKGGNSQAVPPGYGAKANPQSPSME